MTGGRICYAMAGAGRAAELHLNALGRFSSPGGGGLSDKKKSSDKTLDVLRKNKNAMALKK